MRIESGFQANCSELIFHIPSMTAKEVLDTLKDYGIRAVSMDGFWDWDLGDDEEQDDMLADMDNPNCPDYKNHGFMNVHQDYEGCGTFPGASILAHGDGSTPLFPTLKKIEDLFGGEWEGHDGGHEDFYRQWVKEGAVPSNDTQLELFVRCFGVSDVGEVQKILKYASKTYGLTGKIEPLNRTNGYVIEFGNYDPDNLEKCTVHFDKFGGRGLSAFVHMIRKDLNSKANAARGKEHKEKRRAAGPF